MKVNLSLLIAIFWLGFWTRDIVPASFRARLGYLGVNLFTFGLAMMVSLSAYLP
jgi:hypothetical protein